ncbi:urease accessory protein UreE [Kineococcus glutinatus]|uniref:Urease accessory protein UreE n=1 Tax=Kineococcus glutinatus TaxID=1070872 RepID=A0ABP9I6G0_9ACTN
MEATAILGSTGDPAFSGLRVDPVTVPWGDAGKHRQRLRSREGREITLLLPRGSFLADGSVLGVDGGTVVAVERPPQDALVLQFADNTGPAAVRRALLLGYALGNRHAPLEVSAEEVRTPLLTSPEVAERAFHDLGLAGRVDRVPLAAHGWSNTSADHHGEHRHD